MKSSLNPRILINKSFQLLKANHGSCILKGDKKFFADDDRIMNLINAVFFS